MKPPVLSKNDQPTREPTRLSEEPGFILFDLRGTMAIEIPSLPGLLGFLRIDGDQETVIKILMLDDLAKGFLDNIRYAGGADRVTYVPFPSAPDFGLKKAGLAARLELFSALTAKYASQKNTRPGLVS